MLRIFTDNPIVVTVQAGGENLAKYRYFNSINDNALNAGASFTILDGAYGVFSSKMTKTKVMKLGGTTVPELCDSTNWGFKYIGGHF